MTRFLHWRKMTWVILAWNAGALAWLVVTAFDLTGGTANCSTDSAGVALNAITQRDCAAAAGGSLAFELTLGSIFWFLGLATLSAIWFSTRPLWRQGYGFRLRRLREVPHTIRHR